MIMKKAAAPLLLLATVLLGCSGSPSASTAPAVPVGQMTPPFRFSGIITTLGTGTGPQTVMLQAEASALSTEVEMGQWDALLQSKGQTALVDALLKAPEKGWVRIGNNIAYSISVIRAKPLPNGGRQVIFASSRPISAAGVFSGQVSADYPIGLVEFTIGPDGKGKGVIYGMLKAGFKDGQFDLSSYSGGQPQLISDVLMQAGKF
ncbi:MAG TPA: hypothetical protein PLB02_05450 [Thermoanaerobaculia bacterium]|nr:hypothetical protein [Thermoanaerobaculia bacterium]HQR66820.1 hypothetical protein [Thermoanaerobaculia bacterium]